MSSSDSSSGVGGTSNAMAGSTVAGYFANREDAHHAINELVDEGFGSNQIGAAFHSSGVNSGSSAPVSERAVNDIPIRSPGVSGTSDAGPLSGSNAISPLGPKNWGSGPFFTSPSEPPPIPGAETPSGLPREIPSELTSDSDRRAPAQNQGAHTYAYSGSAFESSIQDMGIPPDQARRLSRDLRRGGAVVTVKAGAKRSVVEAILERNHGVIRYETGPVSVDQTRNAGSESGHVQVFGEIHRVYPGYIPEEGVRERKAS